MSATTKDQQEIASLSVLIPVYNSEETIGPLIDAVVRSLRAHFGRLEIIAVNDGSRDETHERLMEARQAHPWILNYVRLARNFGEHNAVLCGLRHVTCDAVAIIDDDFQNPPQEILKLVDVLRQGHDVVFSQYPVTRQRWWRLLGSRFNDWVAGHLLDKPRGLYLSSFKVMNRFLVDAVTRYEGPFPYLDGLVLRSTNAIGTAVCEHRERAAGQSNYNLRRLVALWLNMFTSFSVLPLRLSTFLGVAMSGLGALLSVFFVVSWARGGVFLHGTIPPGWASIVILVTTFAGIQFFMLGLIGEYLGRLFLTSNLHPQFVVREIHRPERPSSGHKKS